MKKFISAVLSLLLLAGGSIAQAELLINDETAASSGLAFLLSQFAPPPELPLPIGVFRAVTTPTCDELNSRLHQDTRAAKGRGDLAALLSGGETWTIE